MQRASSEYAELGAVVLSIVGQWPREVRRYAETHDITFPLLTDKEREVIKSYGVYHWLGLDAYNIARPATFVIDRGLIIRFMYIGSHQFDLVKHEEIVSALKGL